MNLAKFGGVLLIWKRTESEHKKSRELVPCTVAIINCITIQRSSPFVVSNQR
jgi:hypothetical protein